MLKIDKKRLALTSSAILLALAVAPKLSASSIFDIPLPSTCLNNAAVGDSGCPNSSRVNAAVAQQTIAPDFIGDIFYSPVSENINSLALWVEIPDGDIVADDLGTLTLYLGSIGNSQDGSIAPAATTSVNVVPSEYPGGAQYQSLYSSTFSNVYEVIFTLSAPFAVGGPCGTPSAGCYAWAVTSDGDHFAPLMSFQPNQFPDGSGDGYTNIDGGDGHLYGAFTYFTTGGAGLTADTNFGQANDASINGFPLAPSVDFITNVPEPATLGLLGLGLGLIGLKARRRS